MEITPDEQVILNNFKAHLASLKTELKIVSDELATTLRLKEVASIEVDELSVKKESLIKFITDETALIKQDRAMLEIKENSFEEILNAFDQSKIDFKEYTEKTLLSMGVLELTHERKIKEAELKLVDIQEKVEEAECKYTEITDAIEEFVHDVDELEDQKASLERVIPLLKEEITIITKQGDKTIKEYQKKIAKLAVDLDKANADLATPNQALDHKEKIMDRREKNFEIRRVRLQNQIKKYFPGQELIV